MGVSAHYARGLEIKKKYNPCGDISSCLSPSSKLMLSYLVFEGQSRYCFLSPPYVVFLSCRVRAVRDALTGSLLDLVINHFGDGEEVHSGIA